jgi:phosphoribosylformylglycinamidine synthase subunit PurQ / glutaminase
MKFGVITFPGSNSDEDAFLAITDVLGQEGVKLWHKDHDLRGVDVVILPGGFSYGDYLRAGAIARFSPIMREVVAHADRGGPVVGICNGFQIACEAGLLPGALLRNSSLQFVSELVRVRVETAETRFSNQYSPGQILRLPIAHGDGRYTADDATLDRLEQNGQVVFRYVNARGEVDANADPNGSMRGIAGIVNDRGNVLGLMPHPERAAEAIVGSDDGVALFESLLAQVSV